MDHFLGRNDEQMQCRGILHIVEAGDTLYKIGKKYGAPVSRIMYANPYVNVYNLQIGDEICVPVMVPRMPMGETSANGPVNRMPVREHPAQANMAPSFDNYWKGNTEPIYESDVRRYTIPAQEPVERERTVPMAEMTQSSPRTPSPSDQMGFSASIREYGADFNQQVPDSEYMGNCMTPAREMNNSMYGGLGESSKSGMRETLGESGESGMQEALGESGESGMQEALGESDRLGMSQAVEENNKNGMSKMLGENDRNGMPKAFEEASEQADRGGMPETYAEITPKNQRVQGSYPSDMNFL